MSNPKLLDSVRELYNDYRSRNAVNIAGYGRESTHKGYLSWTLNCNRWPEGSTQALFHLCRLAGGQKADVEIPSVEEIENLRCWWEVRIVKRRKVDLCVLYEAGGRHYALPIELKTDRGTSGKHQFEELSDTTEVWLDDQQREIPCRLVLLLGSSSVQRMHVGRFLVVGPDEISAAFSSVRGRRPRFVREWIDAVEMERRRREFAADVFPLHWNEEVSFWDYGYRSREHLYFYVLDRVRRELQSRMPECTWELYHGGHNVVLNLCAPEEISWFQQPTIRSSIFFEFNNAKFLMKVYFGEDFKREAVQAWASRLVTVVKELDDPEIGGFKGTVGGNYSGSTKTLISWNLEKKLIDFKSIGKKVEKIVELVGKLAKKTK